MVKQMMNAMTVAAGLFAATTAMAVPMGGPITNVVVEKANGGAAARGLVPLNPAIDYVVFAQSGNVLSPSAVETEQNAMAGNAAAPGGNIELFAGSENPAFIPTGAASAFATVVQTVIKGDLDRGPVTISSLNGADWFTTDTNTYSTAYGANNLANFWYLDFITTFNLPTAIGALPPALQPLVLADLYNRFRDGGGFARLSDANVSYAYTNAQGDLKIGLAGNFDLKPLVAALLTQLEVQYGLPAGSLVSLLPAGPVQFSEVVKVLFDDFTVANPETAFLYSFVATPTGLTSNDPTDSFDGNYEVTLPGTGVIPEPITATLGLMGLGAVAAAGTRRRLA